MAFPTISSDRPVKILMIAPEPFFEPRGTPFSEYHRIRALLELGHTVDLVTYPFGEDVALPGLRVFRALRPPPVRRVGTAPPARAAAAAAPPRGHRPVVRQGAAGPVARRDRASPCALRAIRHGALARRGRGH